MKIVPFFLNSFIWAIKFSNQLSNIWWNVSGEISNYNLQKLMLKINYAIININNEENDMQGGFNDKYKSNEDGRS